jgi:type I restriction enzyme S subunit
MKLAPYPKHKDSGIEWLGEIPEGWEIRKLKYVANIEMGQSPDSDFYNKEGNGVPFLQGNADFKEIYPRPQVWATEGNKYSKKDDILVSVRAPVGEINISDNRYVIGRGLVAVGYNEKSDFKYYYYLFAVAKNYFDSVATGTTYSAISTDDVKNIVVAVPLLEKQIQISNYLDHQTNRIVDLIKKNEKLIELLKEKRQAIISHAVTKGLDPNAKMKGSGIKWLGEIPEGWKIKRIKHIAKEKFKNGIFKKKDFYGSGVKLINVFDVYRQNFYIDLNSLDHIEATKKEVKIYSVEAGDILFVRSSLKLEGVGASVCVPYINEPLIFECHLVKMQPSFEIVPEYLINFLNANVVRQRFIALANTVTMATLGQSSLSTLEVELPPILEQLAIVDYLKRETTKIDRVINKIQSQIETLKEYRQALISNVVTGKVKINEDQ